MNVLCNGIFDCCPAKCTGSWHFFKLMLKQKKKLQMKVPEMAQHFIIEFASHYFRCKSYT